MALGFRSSGAEGPLLEQSTRAASRRIVVSYQVRLEFLPTMQRRRSPPESAGCVAQKTAAEATETAVSDSGCSCCPGRASSTELGVDSRRLPRRRAVVHQTCQGNPRDLASALVCHIWRTRADSGSWRGKLAIVQPVCWLAEAGQTDLGWPSGHCAKMAT